MNNFNSNESFQNIAEHPSNESYETKNDILYSDIEEFPNSKKIKTFDSLEISSTGLSKQLINKLSSDNQLKGLLTADELENFLKIAEFIKNAEETQLNPEMDLEYIEKSRKQQELIVKILKKISDLQWEVENIYNQVKEKEDFHAVKNNVSVCSMESLGRNVNCTCFII